MKVLQKWIKTNHKEYYKIHLTIINSLLPTKMTDKELEVVAAFLSLSPDIIEDGYFNPLARKKVLNILNISAAGLSNHLKSLIDKGFLSKTIVEDVVTSITIKEFLIPENDNQGYKFKLTKEV